MSLTGFGEVNQNMGSFALLPRRLDCLPALRWPDLGNWGLFWRIASRRQEWERVRPNYPPT
jgi:hypothetical protein